MESSTIKECKLIPATVIGLDKDVIEVAKKLHDFQERRIFVIDKKKFPVGIISIVDINDRVVCRNKNLKKTKAKDIMTYPLHLVVDVKEPVKNVLKKMVLKDNFYVPVIEKGVIKGLLTYANLKKVLEKDGKTIRTNNRRAKKSPKS